MATRAPLDQPAQLRWDLADEPAAQAALFEPTRREIGTGEFRGMEFLHVEARSLLNPVKGDPGFLPFRWTVNPYRGCSHACSYCLGGDTPILMADGRTKRLRDLRKGDWVYGTERRGQYRRYVATEVLDHWSTVREAWQVHLADGTRLVASGDHRFLTERGWKHVADAAGSGQRPHLTFNNALVGVGGLPDPPKHDAAYRSGYLCGMIRGDGTLGRYDYSGRRRANDVHHSFRLALVDGEALDRSEAFLAEEGVKTARYWFAKATATRKPVEAIRSQSKCSFDRITELIAWPSDEPDDQWFKGFLGGIFDAEGSSNGVIRIANCDDEMIEWTLRAARRFAFNLVLEDSGKPNGLRNVRLLGGLRERLRFFHLTDSAITRKRTFDGLAVKGDADLRVIDVRPLGISMPMYDITTGTGDFIADGVISHNCFARQTHTYLGLGAGADFDQRVVVKTNAVELLRAELRPNRWAGELVAMGTNTDPYQRCEGKYRLTRGLIGALIEAENPFSILTKSTLILRDVDLLGAAARKGLVQVSLSIGTVDDDVWRATEPGTPPPARRLRAVRQLNEAGIPTGVLIAPILPGVSDSPEQLAAVAQAVVAAGARTIGHAVLHLRSAETRQVYLARLAATHPEAAAATELRYRGASAPKADRDRIGADLRAAIEAAGGQLGTGLVDGEGDGGATPVTTAVALARRKAAAPPHDQLTLVL